MAMLGGKETGLPKRAWPDGWKAQGRAEAKARIAAEGPRKTARQTTGLAKKNWPDGWKRDARAASKEANLKKYGADQAMQTGSRGGQFYISKSGAKVYVKK